MPLFTVCLIVLVALGRFDRRVDIAYLSEMMNPQCFAGLALAPGFKSPPCDKDWEFYRNYIEEEFPGEHPNLFGMHSNAEISASHLISLFGRMTLFNQAIYSQQRTPCSPQFSKLEVQAVEPSVEAAKMARW